jgi:predicted lipoprotein with Yx(FWY)xxD motif
MSSSSSGSTTATAGSNSGTAASTLSTEKVSGVVTRPDGKRQVAWNGNPLYTFVQDAGSGKVTATAPATASVA